jgi:hypothetical protein
MVLASAATWAPIVAASQPLEALLPGARAGRHHVLIVECQMNIDYRQVASPNAPYLLAAIEHRQADC